MMVKVERKIKKMEAENLSLRGKLVVKRTAFAPALMDNKCLQRYKKLAV